MGEGEVVRLSKDLEASAEAVCFYGTFQAVLMSLFVADV